MEADRDGLTPRQAEILGLFLAAHAAHAGRRPMPTNREVQAATGIGSPNGVVVHLKALARKGWLDTAVAHRARSIRPTSRALARLDGAALVDLAAITRAQAEGLRDVLNRILDGPDTPAGPN